jgi:hypothetical protein
MVADDVRRVGAPGEGRAVKIAGGGSTIAVVGVAVGAGPLPGVGVPVSGGCVGSAPVAVLVGVEEVDEVAFNCTLQAPRVSMRARERMRTGRGEGKVGRMAWDAPSAGQNACETACKDVPLAPTRAVRARYR